MRKAFTITAILFLGLSVLSCRNAGKGDDTPKISIFCDHIETVARQQGISFAEAATMIKELGYSGADIKVFQGNDRIKTLDSLGFAHACAISDIDYSKGDQKDLEDKTLAFMKEKGFDRLLLVPGLMPEGFSQAERDAARQRIAAFASRVVAEGFEIMVEDYDNARSLCYNTERLDSLFALSDDLGLVYDSGNFLFAGEDPMECFEHFRDRIGHVHLKDRTSPTNMACVPAGEGCIPIFEIIDRLTRSGYDGWFTVEQYGSRHMLEDSGVSYENVSVALSL